MPLNLVRRWLVRSPELSASGLRNLWGGGGEFGILLGFGESGGGGGGEIDIF